MNLIKIKKILYSVLYFDCQMCGSWFHTDLGICENCEDKIANLRQKFEINFEESELSSFKVYAYYSYGFKHEKEVKNLSHFLKYLISRRLMLHLCNLIELNKMLESLSHEAATKDKPLILVIPATNNGFHAKNICKYLREFNFNVHEKALQIGYEHQQNGEKKLTQKLLNRDERAGRIVSVHEEFTSEIASAKQIILIDDILTTGATMKAAYKAISSITTAPIVGVTLFYRETFQ